MKFSKKIRWVLLTIVVLWIGITIYFSFQHKVTVRHCEIDKKVEVGDYTIQVDSLTIQNFKTEEYFDMLFYKIAPVIPRFLLKPVYYVNLFYSKPYSFNDQYQYTDLRTHILLDVPIEEIDSNYVDENVIQNIDVDVIDKHGAAYSKGREWQFDPQNGDAIPYTITGRGFPIKKIEEQEPLTIRITDKKSNITKEFMVDTEKLKPEHYGFFQRNPYKTQ